MRLNFLKVTIVVSRTSWSVLQLDVVAFANLAQLHFIDKEVSHPLRDALNDSYPNLVGLVTRVKERAFADWDEICAPIEVPQAKPKEVSHALQLYGSFLSCYTYSEHYKNTNTFFHIDTYLFKICNVFPKSGEGDQRREGG